MSIMNLDDIIRELDFEFFLERESIPFKSSHGVSGLQFNIKTCPNPACGDTRWRTYFGNDTGAGNCFVCDKGFNKLSFIHMYLGSLQWRDTIAFAKDILRDQGWRPRREAVVATTEHNVVLPISRSIPLEDGSNLAYLENRGFTTDIARYFSLMWCEFGWWKYHRDGREKIQDFSGRVIVPVYDLDGDLKTFQGRDITGGSDRKYLFPASLPGTGKFLLNAHNFTATDSIVMGEGVFDVAAIKMALDEDPDLRRVVPVGSFGKHLSYGSMEGDDQLGRFNILKSRGLKFVTIMWDGGAKEIVSALNAAKLINNIGLTARLACLPKGKDPNEVTPDIVRRAYYEASVWTPALDVRWRLRNPYGKA